VQAVQSKSFQGLFDQLLSHNWGDNQPGIAKMAKTYIYKMTVDDGGAPCVRDGILSLAICKPTIRSTAVAENIILGFAADSLHDDNRLIYIAKVTDKLTDGKYFSESPHTSRPDSIYRWNGSRFEWKSDAKFHSAHDLAHDLGDGPEYKRANVLLSEDEENFRYFGAACPISYKAEYPVLQSLIERLGQGSRVNHEPGLEAELRRFIQRLWHTPWPYRETAVPNAPCRDKCSQADDEDFDIHC
jgi:Nucleotide modification associated domain 2